MVKIWLSIIHGGRGIAERILVMAAELLLAFFQLRCPSLPPHFYTNMYQFCLQETDEDESQEGGRVFDE